MALRSFVQGLWLFTHQKLSFNSKYLCLHFHPSRKPQSFFYSCRVQVTCGFFTHKELRWRYAAEHALQVLNSMVNGASHLQKRQELPPLYLHLLLAQTWGWERAPPHRFVAAPTDPMIRGPATVDTSSINLQHLPYGVN